LVSDTPAPTKIKPKGGKKPVLTSKQMAARYRALYSMLLELSFTPDQQVTATKYAVKGIGNTSNDGRVPAYDCMGELYRAMGGDEISRYYEGLRQASLDALMAKFAEIDESQGHPTKQPKKQAPAKPEQHIETNIRDGRAGKKAAPRRAAQEQPAYDAYEEEQKQGGGEEMGQCNFCLRQDPSFNDESLDIHYWKECPVLTTCWECD
jgi:hypothetical protein